MQDLIADILLINREIRAKNEKVDAEGYIDTTETDCLASQPPIKRVQLVRLDQGIQIEEGITDTRLHLATIGFATGQWGRWTKTSEGILLQNRQYDYPNDRSYAVRNTMSINRDTKTGVSLITSGVRSLQSGAFHPSAGEIPVAYLSQNPPKLEVELFNDQTPRDLLVRFRDRLKNFGL